MSGKNNFSNFYDEFAYNQKQFDLLKSFFDGIGNIIGEMLNQIADNMIIPSMGIYSYIPIQLIPLAEAVYDVEKIMSEPSVITRFSIEGLSLVQRVAYWKNTISLDDKVSVLDEHGKYVLLTAAQNAFADNKSYSIVDITLKTLSGESLLRNVDYVFSDNKLYLTKNASSYSGNNGSIIAENITIDYEVIQRRMESKLQTSKPSGMTKNEYRDILQAFAEIGLGGPQLKNLNETLRALSSYGNFKVVDQISAGPDDAQFWDSSVRGSLALGPFDFLVLAPPDVTSDNVISDMLSRYINSIGLSYTNMYISPSLDITDGYRMNRLNNTISAMLSLSVLNSGGTFDKIEVSESLSTEVSSGVSESMTNIGTMYRYDSIGNTFDQQLRFDQNHTVNPGQYADTIGIELIPN